MSGTAITPEVLPPEKANVQVVEHLSDDEPVVRYHLAAERCGTLSVWCAAMAGAEIIRKKKELGHGNGFRQWKEKLPFSLATAHNYESLAKQLEQRISALPAAERAALFPAVSEARQEAGNALALLNLPSPMDVFNPAHERIAKVIRHVTNERTLTQLYFDWEIMKAPKPMGGARVAAADSMSPADREAHYEKVFREKWGLLMDELRGQAIKGRTYQYLPRFLIEAIVGGLEEARKELMQYLAAMPKGANAKGPRIE